MAEIEQNFALTYIRESLVDFRVAEPHTLSIPYYMVRTIVTDGPNRSQYNRIMFAR